MARKSQNGKNIKVEPVFRTDKDAASDNRIWQRLAELLAKAIGD